MTKEEAKQYIRTQIDSSIKIQIDDDVFDLCYNNSYLRALKLSKITSNPVNKENFKGGEALFGFNTKSKQYWTYFKIRNYLIKNYSTKYSERMKIIKEVFKEYEEYKDYRFCF